MNDHLQSQSCVTATAVQNGQDHHDHDCSCAEVALTVEVCQCSTSSADPLQIANHVRQYLSNRSFVYRDEVIPISAEDTFLQNHVESIRLCDTDTDREAALGSRLLFWQVQTCSCWMYSSLKLFSIVSCECPAVPSQYIHPTKANP